MSNIRRNLMAAGRRGGSAVDWESIARGMIDGTTEFHIGQDVADALEGMTTLPRRAFWNHKNLLGDVVMPESLTTIDGGENFYNCTSVESITLGTLVTSINGAAFQYMGSAMKELIIKATTPPTLTAANMLSGTGSCIVYVPDASVAAYKAAQYWSAYESRIKGISEKPT